MNFFALVKKALVAFLDLGMPPSVVQDPQNPVPRTLYMVQQFDWSTSCWRYLHWLGTHESRTEAWHCINQARLSKNVRVAQVQQM